MAPENKISDFPFPSDIIQKGKEMTEAYFNIYLIENFLRLFIEKVSIAIYGDNYIDKIKIGASLNKKIKERKKEERRKQWLSIRGDSNLFYIDLIDLKTLISSNWELFESYFPKEPWITSKLEELYDLRIKVAHNSYLDQHEQNTLESAINSIYRQLNVDLIIKKQDQLKDAEYFEDNSISEISTLMSEIRLLIKNEPPDYIIKIHNKMDELLLKAKSLIDKRQRKALGKAYILFNNALQVKPPMKKTLQTLFDLINIILLGR